MTFQTNRQVTREVSMLLFSGSEDEYTDECEKAKGAVLEILQTAYRERRLRIPQQPYVFRAFPIRKEDGGRYLIIIVGNWARYVGLETELEFRFPDYRRIFVLYAEEHLHLGDDQVLVNFLLRFSKKRPRPTEENDDPS